MTARTRSQIGKASREKGARFERSIATALQPWFPDVRRSRDNGSATTADTGDLAGTPGLFWSLKDDREGDTSAPAVINKWMTEAKTKGGGALALLVQKRRALADPLRSWCWLETDELAHLLGGTPVAGAAGLVRMELQHALPLLAARSKECA